MPFTVAILVIILSYTWYLEPRVGLELVTGGSESAGPRIFAKLFAVWGPAVKWV